MTALRAEATGDDGAIRAVHDAAFGQTAEGRLVDELRRAGDLVLSLVACEGALVVGHVALSRVHIDGRPLALALAPVAVLPGRQRRGIGSLLIRGALDRLAHRGERIVFVVGAPDYYRRFGFDAAVAAPFRTPYAGPHFQALRLGTRFPSGGRLRYPAAFARLG